MLILDLRIFLAILAIDIFINVLANFYMEFKINISIDIVLIYSIYSITCLELQSDLTIMVENEIILSTS